MKNILLLFCLVFIAGIYNAKAQFVYPNDICSGAMPLPIGNTGQLSDSAFQWHFYANQVASTIPDCSGNLSGTARDLWYSFIAPETSIAVVPEQVVNGGRYQLFSGSCAGLTSMQCNPSPLSFPDLVSLVPGQQYYLRTFAVQTGHKLSLLSKPINDECTGAALLPVNAVNAPVSETLRFTNALSTVPLNNDCYFNAQFNGHKDLWYKFIATSTSHTVYMLTPMTQTKAQVYGGVPGNFTPLAYHNFNTGGSTANLQLSNLSIGSIYYIRVGAPVVVTFKMAIFQGTPPNDECANADTISISSSFKCENSFAVNRITATKSTMPCLNSTERNLWYIFKATSTGITVSTSGDGAFALKLGLLEGSCGATSCLVNSGAANFSYNGLTVGNYYYLVAGGISSPEQTAYICIAPQISNDECGNAIPLVVKPYNLLRTNIGYNKGATQSIPSCINTNNIADVWYRFNATDTACLITADAPTANFNFQVFSGGCNSLNSIHCSSSQQLPANVNERTERVGGLITGNNYYLRFYTGNTFGGTFTIDINSLPLNDTCTGAIELIPQQDLVYDPIINNGILHASTSSPACVALPVTKDIWYKFIATHPSMAIITNRESGSNGDLSYLGLEIYSGSCGSLTSIACIQQGNPFSRHKARTFTDLVVGQTYYIRQYGNVANNKITIIKPPVNDEMSGAIKLVPAAANVQTLPSYYLHGASKEFGKICSSGNYAVNHDVWFYFIATEASHTVSTNDNNTYWDNDQGFYYYRLETFRGYAADSTSLVPKAINCGQGSVTVNGLVAGDTVYVRISNLAAAGITSIFSVKVSSTQSMDEPAGALVLNKLNSYQYSVKTAGATQSLPATGCTMPDFPDDDIWFKFTASAVNKRNCSRV